MIIISQDKNTITSDWDLFVSHPNVWVIKSSMGIIGEYTTEEKVIKVLDMIEDAHRNIVFTDGVVFHMPQDSEV